MTKTINRNIWEVGNRDDADDDDGETTEKRGDEYSNERTNQRSNGPAYEWMNEFIK